MLLRRLAEYILHLYSVADVLCDARTGGSTCLLEILSQQTLTPAKPAML